MQDKVTELHKTTMLDVSINWYETHLQTFHKAYNKHKRKNKYTTEFIAEEVRVDKSTADKWSTGKAAPQGGSLMALQDLFGPEFVTDMLIPISMAGVYRVDSTHVTPEMLHTCVASLTHLITSAREDNDIDPQEDAEIKREAASAVTILVNYIANGKGRA